MDIQQHMWISYPRLGNWSGNACPLEVALLPGLGSQAEWKGKSEQSLVTLCFITIEAMWPGAFSSCHLPSPQGMFEPQKPLPPLSGLLEVSFVITTRKRRRHHLWYFWVHDSAVLHTSRYCTTSLEIFHFAKLSFYSLNTAPVWILSNRKQCRREGVEFWVSFGGRSLRQLAPSHPQSVTENERLKTRLLLFSSVSLLLHNSWLPA